MFEVIVTMVMTETQDGTTYPVTDVRRVEFDTEEDMRNAIADLESAHGVTNADILRHQE